MPSDEFSIGRKILKIGNKLINTRNKDLRKLDLTSNQSETILFFKRNHGVRIQDLKNHLEISHQAARNIVERMKKKQLLEVEVYEDDARSKHIHLSPKGHKKYTILETCGTNVSQVMLKKLTKKEKAALSDLLDKISR